MACVPCLLGVGFNALWDASQLPPSVWQQREVGPIEFGAPEAEFQGLTLERPEPLTQLTRYSVRGSIPARHVPRAPSQPSPDATGRWPHLAFIATRGAVGSPP